MRKWISREEEASFPEFGSFQDAWDFFLGMFEEDIVLETVDIINGEKCYFCALITDWESYREMNRFFEDGMPVSGMKYLECRQSIQIFENGQVHIVH